LQPAVAASNAVTITREGTQRKSVGLKGIVFEGKQQKLMVQSRDLPFNGHIFISNSAHLRTIGHVERLDL
jgi:hypothetical protein